LKTHTIVSLLKQIPEETYGLDGNNCHHSRIR
jgi:hypothetical protein